MIDNIPILQRHLSARLALGMMPFVLVGGFLVFCGLALAVLG